MEVTVVLGVYSAFWRACMRQAVSAPAASSPAASSSSAASPPQAAAIATGAGTAPAPVSEGVASFKIFRK